MKLEKK